MNAKKSIGEGRNPSRMTSKDQSGDWKASLEQMQQGLNAMQKEAEAIPAKYGLTKENFESLLVDSAHFSPADWQLIEEARKKSQALKEELAALMKSPLIKKEERQKKKSQPKKNWIPLQ